MKILFTILFGGLFISGNDGLVNSVWTCKIADGCIDILRFKPNSVALAYDCEVNYTFNCRYKIVKDTLFVIEKDDSHPEDSGKVTYRKMKYVLKKNILVPFENTELSGKWRTVKVKFDKGFIYKRMK